MFVCSASVPRSMWDALTDGVWVDAAIQNNVSNIWTDQPYYIAGDTGALGVGGGQALRGEAR